MTPYDTMMRLAGEMRERPGERDHPAILWAHELCGLSDVHDETPWCSSGLNLVFWLHRKDRSKSARARSWLLVGASVEKDQARIGDVVILKRGGQGQPGPHIIKAPGHVGLFAGWDGNYVRIAGCNQSDGVNVSRYPSRRILGIRRVA